MFLLFAACSSGKYGMNCNSTCGQCKDDACDILSGNCTEGCMDDYYGPLCKECEFPFINYYLPVIYCPYSA